MRRIHHPAWVMTAPWGAGIVNWQAPRMEGFHMSFAGWMIFIAIVVPIVGALIYFLADDALIRVDPGKLGLLVIKGRATDKTLQPGPHFVPAFRRMTVEEYPSLELSYR